MQNIRKRIEKLEKEYKKTEKTKKCDFCEGTKVGDYPKKTLFEKNVNFGVCGKHTLALAVMKTEKDGGILDLGFGNTDYDIKISYCPMCGRKL